MDFAIIETGGKQYPVKQGDSIVIEKLQGEFNEGDKITFDKVLLTQTGTAAKVGAPFLDKAKVSGTLKKIGRSQKIIVTHYKQKSRYWKRNGHRQNYFEVTIDSIK